VVYQNLLLRVVEADDGFHLYASGHVRLSREEAGKLAERLVGKRGKRPGPSEVKE
jgi:lysophospholipase L1-like esterase